MKRILIVIFIALLFSNNIFGQEALKRGVYSLGGAITYSSSNNDSDFGSYRIKTFSCRPNISLFVINNLSVGLVFSYAYDENKFNDVLNISRQYSIGPNLRYYFNADELIPFVGIGYSYSNKIGVYDDANEVLIEVGMNYFLSISIAMEPFLEYKKSTAMQFNHKAEKYSIGVRINYFIL